MPSSRSPIISAIPLAFSAIFFLATSNFAAINPKDTASVSAALKSATPQQLPGLILEIKQALFEYPEHVLAKLRTNWINALITSHHNAEAADLAFEAILTDPNDTSAVFDFQELRVHALLRSGDYAQALIQSKALFNVASMEHTDQALITVATCLAAAYPEDRAIVERFRKEQVAGATAHVQHGKSTTAPGEDASIVSTLKSIRLDPAPYEETIATLDPAEQRTARANLLLLAGKTDEARHLLQKNLEHEMTEGERRPEDVGRAAEEVARCIKAEDGLIGRANAFLLSIQF